jgi:hypothetical protein
MIPESRVGAESLWADLTTCSEAYTCYSAAVASWAAYERLDWRSLVDPGLTLTVCEADAGLFGFVHFPAELRAELGLERMRVERAADALDGVLAEIERSGRAIVAGDGMRLPWHVAHGKRHVPHWYVLAGTLDRLQAIDPFACRNELGVQQATRVPVAREQLGELLCALPDGDPVFALRERLALGDDCGPWQGGGYQWFVRAQVSDGQAPSGAQGVEAVEALVRHFAERTQDPDAYVQADDVWSIARHRAFFAQRAAARAQTSGEDALEEWSHEHVQPLAKRWAHMAPLLLQARLALSVGRSASDSVFTTLQELVERERAAAQTCPAVLDAASI